MSSVQIFNGKEMQKGPEWIKNIDASDIPYFAERIISKILSYLEVKSSLMGKSVCKLWYAIIKENEFVKTHMTRNKWRFQVFERNYESFNSERSYYYLSIINGLLPKERKSSTTTCQISNSDKECSNSVFKVLDLGPPGRP